MAELPTQATLRKSEEIASDETDVKQAIPDSDDKPRLGYNYGFDNDNQFYVPDLDYTPEEERKVIRILDTRLFTWLLLTTFVLNMDRTNHSNAISDNLPQDLGFTINVVNTGVALNAVCFSVTCITGAVIAKIAGPSRWISFLMLSWGLVTLAHALIENQAGYLAVRCFIAITEGGVIPSTLVYMGAFYKSTELATRLAWFWGVQWTHGKVHISFSLSLLSDMEAPHSGLLQMRGINGLYGWKWLFIIDGILTIIVAIATWFYLPQNAATTKGGIRGFKPWFDERQVRISVTRVVRDDIAKRKYETKVTWADIKDSLTDIGLWLHLIVTMVGQTPTIPLATYLPTVIQSFSFNVFVSNALTAPPYTLLCITMVLLVWHSDRVHERGWHNTFSAVWFLVGWILLRALPHTASRGVKYIAACIVQSYPQWHPLNIAWMDENMGTIGKKTVASGMVIASANIYGVRYIRTMMHPVSFGGRSSSSFGQEINPVPTFERTDFKRGNTINIVFSGLGVLLFLAMKLYYSYQNAQNARRWAAMSEEEREKEELEAEKKGNRSVTFRFTT
ncbi:MFS general substrate transporter [Fomitiporia mediterranea MF3/22]|uniref:MFS general substrate transporter n=1 Tax=Fomitiporia mediterranea (strain MF3/22) TaxID=694068 RepID=UPI0004408B2A|nr:MFS general substrate transporter [Fomitiporia mediterranea MF3/22]EJD04829.1 MFS general substrate transporter [Fomitiporia mediterranea MF3/22]